MTSLGEVHHTTGTTEQAIKIGDVAQIHDDALGVIEELVRGNDGFIRSVTLCTANGRTNRPIACLYPLEVEDSSTSVNSPKQVSESPVQNDDGTSRRHPRGAAVRSRDQLKEWTDILRCPPSPGGC